jgi:hypothetical protein
MKRLLSIICLALAAATVQAAPPEVTASTQTITVNINGQTAWPENAMTLQTFESDDRATTAPISANQIGWEIDTKKLYLPSGTEPGNWSELVTKAAVGLGNVDNTSDLDKPISTATQAALDAIPGKVVNVQTFEADGTWTKPAGAVGEADVIVIGGGGGGGSGRHDSAGTARGGGGGGGGAAWVRARLRVDGLGDTEPVTVGAGGAGGAAVSGASANGNDGVTGGSSAFSYITAVGGDRGRGGTTGVGAGGTANSNVVKWELLSLSALGGAAPPLGQNSSLALPSGGGAGSTLSSANAWTAGIRGGNNAAHTGGAPGTQTTAGSDGSDGGVIWAGTGGGGGGSGQPGGHGGKYGAGGGGGGSSDGISGSGAGGDGGGGVVVVITYCVPTP